MQKFLSFVFKQENQKRYKTIYLSDIIEIVLDIDKRVWLKEESNVNKTSSWME